MSRITNIKVQLTADRRTTIVTYRSGERCMSAALPYDLSADEARRFIESERSEIARREMRK